MRFLLANNRCITDPTIGETHSLRAIMRWLAEAGHECCILTTARSGSPRIFSITDHLKEVGATGSQISGMSTAHYRVGGIPVTLLLTRHNDEARPNPTESRQYIEIFRGLLDEFAPDQVIASDAHPMIPQALAEARRREITTVFTLRFAGNQDRQYFEAIDHVFTASPYVTAAYAAAIGLISTPIESPIEWSDVLAPTESRAFVTFVNPARHKGLLLFARLADMLGSRRPDIPILVIQSGQTAGSLNSIPGIDFSKYPQIMAAPFVPKPAEFFALTRILLVPSVIEEAFGRVSAEAMINGIPPIVSNRGGLPQTIGGDFSVGGGGRVLPLPDWLDAVTVRLPSEEEVEPWFEAVCSLWDDPVLYQRMAARAFEIAQERYSEEVSRKRHVNYLTTLQPGARLFV